MSNYGFGTQKQKLFGSFGEFSVGIGENRVRAKYVLTKIRPGNDGDWANLLASQMAPWREVFKIEELSFEELIQRDLDDSRVAHDLIPYLLGESGHHARFFPPVLAVLVPRKDVGTGIKAQYPPARTEGEKEVFDTLFDFEQVLIENEKSPLGMLQYNAQKTAMVVVDGQHRAMAVLALHRQLNNDWQDKAFAPYYHHIQVTSQAVKNIELPVCVIYFPDVHDNNHALKEAGVDLITVCREIFTVVNKSAKPVGKSRELLLNDDDYAAIMMRQTLSALKGRTASSRGTARIYSFAFGDEDNIGGGQVLAGRLEYSSAIAIYKMHGATSFSMPAAFATTNTSDVTDDRKVRNSSRPVNLLIGEDFSLPQSLGKRSAKSHSPVLKDEVVSRIGNLTDLIILPLFDELRPFVVHNEAMQELLVALNDPNAQSSLIQSKCRSLIFDGSGTRAVFDEHTERLKERREDLSNAGQTIPPHLDEQIVYCDSVSRALEAHDADFKLKRAFKLFNIDTSAFSARDNTVVEDETKVVKSIAKTIFDTVSTQAFQIGYLMAAQTTIERMCPVGTTYADRVRRTKFISSLYLAGVNSLFATAATKHRSLSGYVSELRAKAFDSSAEGFRGLLKAGNVSELNEKQWEFFRFVVLELVHSKRAFEKVNAVLASDNWENEAGRYREILAKLLEDVDALRRRYIDAAVRTAVSAADFANEKMQKHAECRAAGKSDVETAEEVAKLVTSKQRVVEQACAQHLSASLGALEKRSIQLTRLGAQSTFSPAASNEPGSQGAEGEVTAVEVHNTSTNEIPNGDQRPHA
jgi:hypothetical protein